MRASQPSSALSGAAREDGHAADDPHRADLVGAGGQRAADAGDDRGGDGGRAQDRREQVRARLVDRREGGRRGEGRGGGGTLAGVPPDRQDADERAREQHPDRDGADRVLARASGVPPGEDGDERRDRGDHRGEGRALGSVLGGLAERLLAGPVDAGGRDQHVAGLDAGLRQRLGGVEPLAEGGLQQGMATASPSWAACLAYSRATSTDVAALGTTRSSTPAGPCTLTAMVAPAGLGIATSDTDSPFRAPGGRSVR